jgi:hypothetical protein
MHVTIAPTVNKTRPIVAFFIVKTSPMHLTHQQQQDALQQFKQSLGQQYDASQHSDFLLFRFLRARKYDIALSTKMFTDYLQWRQEAQVDSIVQNFAFTEAEKMRQYYPQFYHKTDKMGRTVYIEQLGKLDVNELLQVTTTERLMTRHIREYEKFTRYRLAACTAKQGTNIENGFTILDLKGVPLSQFNSVRKLINQLTSISSNYYPETLGKMFVINAPTLFTAIWSVLKGMLDENTVAKIHILGSSYSKQLLEHVDAKNLPKFLGGECECPGGCDRSDVGPWNDGSVPGYPIPLWEDFKIRDKGYS